jgi:hypothetical protein
MPTARELLDQADALMRRNRKRGKGGLTDVPTLTDALQTQRDMALAPTLILSDAPSSDPIALDANKSDSTARREAIDGDPITLDTLTDVPVLTDVVLDWPPDSPLRSEPDATPRAATAEGDDAPTDAVATGDAFPASAAEAEVAAAELAPPAVLEREADITSTTDGEFSEVAEHAGEPVQASATPRVPFLDDDFILELPPADSSVAVASARPTTAPVIAAATSLSSGDRDWDAMAEEIRMQVLQRLDLFTDTGLREQLGARLAPIVEHASAQLIETINRELGELVRGYVAEAIEREIDSWRNQNPKSGPGS